jgi:hypothetical protein
MDEAPRRLRARRRALIRIHGDAAAFFPLKPNTTLNSFAGAVADPLSSDVAATSAGDPNVIRGLEIGQGGHQLGLVELGSLPDELLGRIGGVLLDCVL